MKSVTLIDGTGRMQQEAATGEHTRFLKVVATARPESAMLILGLWAVPISIAVSDFFLTIALLVRIARLARGDDRPAFPHVFRFWALWAVLEILVWRLSPEPSLGWGEMHHLPLIGSLFLVLPILHQADDLLFVWQGIFLAARLSFLFLIGDFVSRIF